MACQLCWHEKLRRRKSEGGAGIFTRFWRAFLLKPLSLPAAGRLPAPPERQFCAARSAAINFVQNRFGFGSINAPVIFSIKFNFTVDFFAILVYKSTDKRSQVSCNKLISLNNFKERHFSYSHFNIFAKPILPQWLLQANTLLVNDSLVTYRSVPEAHTRTLETRGLAIMKSVLIISRFRGI